MQDRKQQQIKKNNILQIEKKMSEKQEQQFKKRQKMLKQKAEIQKFKAMLDSSKFQQMVQKKRPILPQQRLRLRDLYLQEMYKQNFEDVKR